VFRGREFFRHGSAEIGDGFTDFFTDDKVGVVGLLLSDYIFSFQFRFGLRGAKKIGDY
jgi:hypothetical protein